MGDDLRQRCITALENASGGLQLTREQAVDAMLEEVQPIITTLAVVSLDDPCVECREPFQKGDRVSWRLRYLPQGLIHEECQ